MPRIPQGMFKRGSAHYCRTWEGGRDRRRSLGPDYSKALEAFDRIKLGTGTAAPLATVAELGERWLNLSVATRRTARGLREARSAFQRLLSRFMGNLSIDHVRPDHLREYRLWLERRACRKTGEPYKPETVRHCLKDAKALFAWSEEAGYLNKSPFPKRLMPRIPERVPNPYSEEEVTRLRSIRDPYRWVIRLGLATGLRWGELCSVRASDTQKDGTLVLLQPKTGTVKRIPLPPDLVRDIQGRVGRLVPFSSTSKSSFARVVRRASGVNGFGPRRLRCTAAMRWLDSGVTLVAIQQMLGHKSIVTTQRYCRLTDQAVRREMERLWERTGTVSGTPGVNESINETAQVLELPSTLGR